MHSHWLAYRAPVAKALDSDRDLVPNSFRKEELVPPEVFGVRDGAFQNGKVACPSGLQDDDGAVQKAPSPKATACSSRLRTQEKYIANRELGTIPEDRRERHPVHSSCCSRARV